MKPSVFHVRSTSPHSGLLLRLDISSDGDSAADAPPFPRPRRATASDDAAPAQPVEIGSEGRAAAAVACCMAEPPDASTVAELLERGCAVPLTLLRELLL